MHILHTARIGTVNSIQYDVWEGMGSIPIRDFFFVTRLQHDEYSIFQISTVKHVKSKILTKKKQEN